MITIEENQIERQAIRHAGHSLAPTVIFYEVKIDEEIKIFVTHEGGMMRLEAGILTEVPNLTWDMVENWVHNNQMIHHCMQDVDPDWRDFILSSLKPGEI